ncbi:MAG: hypothetical protein K0U45_01150 [Alphaproteobacteria bacterium]|nr:hypothetical protein [Alphaproteobacteria bacterium]
MPLTHLHAQIGQYRGVAPEQTSNTYLGFVTGFLPAIDTTSDNYIVMDNNHSLGLLWGYQSNKYLAVEFMQKNVIIADAVFQARAGTQNSYFIGSGKLDMRSFNFNYFIKDISTEEAGEGTRHLVLSYGIGQYKGAYEGSGKTNKTDLFRVEHGDSGYFNRFAFGVQTQYKELIKRGGIRTSIDMRINYYHEQITTSDFYDPNLFDTGLIGSISGIEFMVLSSF